MRAHALPEVREYADLMLEELRKVIPSFLKRLDVPERGVAWTEYLRATKGATGELVSSMLEQHRDEPIESVRLVDFDPEASSEYSRPSSSPIRTLRTTTSSRVSR